MTRTHRRPLAASPLPRFALSFPRVAASLPRVAASLPRVAAVAPSLAVAASLIGCADETSEPTQPEAQLIQSELARAVPDVDDEDLRSLRIGNRDFALELYHAVDIARPNYMLSPLSVRTAFALLYGGAAGDTATEIADTLHFNLEPDRVHPAFNAQDRAIDELNWVSDDGERETVVQLSNAFFGHRGIEWHEAFLDLLAVNYGAGIYSLDLRTNREAARRVINEWVAERTAGHIPDLLPEDALSELTAAVLTNALYLEAEWSTPFAEFGTFPGDFSRLDGTTVDADFMNATSGFLYGEGEGYQAVELSYTPGRLAMLLIVPDRGTFDTFRASFDREELDAIVDGLDYMETWIRVPKFAFDTSVGLRESLIALGMGGQVFEVGDFSNMADLQLPAVDEVYHQTTIEIDELGTTATAATAIVVIEDISARPIDAELVADRPFIFVIRDKRDDVIFFVGHVTDPTAE